MDNTLSSKIAAARQAGYSDNEINSHLMQTHGVQIQPASMNVPDVAPKEGLASRLVKGFVKPLVQTGSGVSNFIGNSEVRLAHALGLAKDVKTQSSTEQFKGVPLVENQSPLQFVGNAAQSALSFIPGAGEASLAGKVAQGAKIGAAYGGAGALADGGGIDQIAGGAIKGGLVGGALGGAAGLLGKLAPKGAAKSVLAETAPVTEAAPTVITGGKRIPVQFAEDANFTPQQAPVTTTTNKLMINPTIEDLQGLGGPGNKSILKRFMSSQEQVPYVKSATTSTHVPVSQGTSYANSIQDIPNTAVSQLPEQAIAPSLQAASEAVPQAQGGKLSNAFINKGNELEARAGGYQAGTKQGPNVTSLAKEGEYNQWLNDRGISGSARSQLASVEASKADSMTKLQDAISNSKATVTPAETQMTVSKLMNEASNIPGAAKEQALADAHAFAQDIAKADTPQKLLDLKRRIDKGVSYTRNSATATPATQQVAEMARTHVNELLKDIVPTAGEHSANYSIASDISDHLEAAAKNPKGFKLLGNNLGGNVRQNVQGLAGKTFKKIGNGLAGTAESTIPTAGGSSLFSKINPGVIGGVLAGSDQAPQAQSPQDQATLAPEIPNNVTQQPTTPFTKDNIQRAIMTDIATTGGKNTAQLLSLYSAFGKDQTLSTDQKKQMTALDTADTVLSTMGDQLQKLGGGQGRVKGAISGLLGHVGLNNDVNAYNSTKTDAAIQIAKALTGGSRAPESVIKNIEASLPLVTDNPEEAQKKIDLISERMQAIKKSISGQ
jgi:hypothetical protein